MTKSRDPTAVTYSYHAYRELLNLYPRRFRSQYREEMAFLFRDCCLTTFNDRGAWGLMLLWSRMLGDLIHNVPKEYAMNLLKPQNASVLATRSCSSCYAVIEPGWRVCRICGMVLNDGTTHETREDRRPVPSATLFGSINRPIRSKTPKG